MASEGTQKESELNSISVVTPSVQINNLELLHYYAYKMTDLFNSQTEGNLIKSFNRNLMSIERWKLLRNILLIALYATFIIIKPGWCDMKNNMKSDCSATEGTEGGQTKYFLIYPIEFKDSNTFELTSWIIMLILIFYEMILVEINPPLILLYSFLFMTDVTTGILFMKAILTIKINILARILFLAVYT